MSGPLRPSAVVDGVFIALIGTPYDMETEDRGRISGTSYKAHVAELGDEGVFTAVHALKVPADLVEAVAKIDFGLGVKVEATGFGKVVRGRSVTDWQVAAVTDSITGEVLCRRAIRAAS